MTELSINSNSVLFFLLSEHPYIFRSVFDLYKLERVFPMVVVSILPYAEFGPNDHRRCASLYLCSKTNFKNTNWKSWLFINENIFNFTHEYWINKCAVTNERKFWARLLAWSSSTPVLRGLNYCTFDRNNCAPMELFSVECVGSWMQNDDFYLFSWFVFE